MVLVVNGVLQEEPPTDSRSLYTAHPIYRETAAQLHMMPAKLVGPAGLLYVQQREMAATLPHDSELQGRIMHQAYVRVIIGTGLSWLAVIAC